MDDTPRLLLVEDDAVSRAFLSQALESLPARVDAAACGADALALARRHDYALLLIDANLPDMRGEALLHRLHASDVAVPALALTADAIAPRREILLAAGFDAVLIKPLNVATLLAGVCHALGSDARIAKTPPPLWNGTRALAAANGNSAISDALRQLFLTELPSQHAAVMTALATGDIAAAQAVLHKLKASCGFVGAQRLLDAVHALSAAPRGPSQHAAFTHVVAEVLASD